MEQVCELDLEHGVVLTVINILLAIIGTFGNIFIILAVLNTPRLRQKPSNFLLLSLAVADLLMTMVAQPLFATSLCLSAFSHRCYSQLNVAYLIIAPLAGGCSVFHLTAISIDRALSALKPHKHYDIIKKRFKAMIACCWVLAALVVCILALYPPARAAVYIALLLCPAVMIVSYGLILYKILNTHAVHTAGSSARDRAMEKRVSGTVAIIILLFAVCWIPLVVFQQSHSTTTVTETTYWWIRTLYLANSSMNFIVYSLRIRQFRAAYLKIINKNLRKFCLMLPEKCRCCIATFDLSSDFTSTQNTPVSPTSAVTMPPLNLIPRD